MVYWLELRLTHFEFQFEVDTMRGRDLRQFTVAVPTCKWLYEPSELRSVDLFAGVSIDDVSDYMQTLFLPGNALASYDVAYPLSTIPEPAGPLGEPPRLDRRPRTPAKRGTRPRPVLWRPTLGWPASWPIRAKRRWQLRELVP